MSKTAKIIAVIEKGDERMTRNGKQYTSYKVDLGNKYPNWVKQWPNNSVPFVGQEYEQDSYEMNGETKYDWKPTKNNPSVKIADTNVNKEMPEYEQVDYDNIVPNEPTQSAPIPAQEEYKQVAARAVEAPKKSTMTEKDELILKQTCLKVAGETYQGRGEVKEVVKAAREFYVEVTEGIW